MTAYYNEIDPYAAQWLRNLIDAGQIAPGIVDERSIEDVLPSDLDGFTQCHFFAGIGVWSYAARCAGWPDDRPLWTGSCPCQPFSAAGAGAGFADERHLWPAFFHLIEKRRPECIVGEQVASKDAEPWIDLVQADMEGLGYPFGAVPFPSAGVGAPHIRDRLYWVADAAGQRPPAGTRLPRRRHAAHELERLGAAGGLANTERHYRGRQASAADHRQPEADRPADWVGGCGGAPGGLDHALGDRRREGRHDHSGNDRLIADATSVSCWPGATQGFWSAADWLRCRDGRWRAVEPGASPLATGAPARVGRLRAYGNAINAEAARIFIECVMQAA